MKSKDLIDEYESKRGKKPIVDGQETIGFKRWKQQHKSNSKLDDVILKFSDKFKKDVKDIIKIYLEKTHISSKDPIKYLRNYIELIFPSEVSYNNQLFGIDLDKSLYLYNLGITDLRNVKGLFKLRFLEELNISENGLDSLPKEINNLINLKVFHIDYNNLRKFPKGIGNLTNLEILWMDHNKISEIPKEIGNLKNLKELYIYDNKISKVSKEIGNLKNLEILNIAHNEISILPKEIGNLMNLDNINLSYNDLSENDIPNNLLNDNNIEITL